MSGAHSATDPGTRALIYDTTLRDGEQSPGCTMTFEVARQLARLGVGIIEAGFPIASSGDPAAVHQIAREVGGPGGPLISALARANEEDIDRAEVFARFKELCDRKKMMGDRAIEASRRLYAYSRSRRARRRLRRAGTALMLVSYAAPDARGRTYGGDTSACALPHGLTARWEPKRLPHGGSGGSQGWTCVSARRAPRPCFVIASARRDP